MKLTFKSVRITADDFFLGLFRNVPKDSDVLCEHRLIKTCAKPHFYAMNGGIATPHDRENSEGYNIYHGINPRILRSPQHGTKYDIACIVAMGIDLDAKDYLTDPVAITQGDFEAIQAAKPLVLEDIQAMIDNTGLVPSSVLDSGRGYQLYYFLDVPEPLPRLDMHEVVVKKKKEWLPQPGQDDLLSLWTSSVNRVESLNKRLGQLFQHADSTQNIDRVFRSPGSNNMKPRRKNKKSEIKRLKLDPASLPAEDLTPINQPVTILWWSPDTRYSLEALESALPAPEAMKRQTRISRSTAEPLPDEWIVQQIQQTDPKTWDCWNGHGTGDRSDDAFKVLTSLAFWTGKDAAQMRSLFERSPLCTLYNDDGKWDRLADHDINKAISKQQDTYIGLGPKNTTPPPTPPRLPAPSQQARRLRGGAAWAGANTKPEETRPRGRAQIMLDFMEHDYAFSYNEIAALPYVNGEQLSDEIESELYVKCVNAGIKGGKALMRDVIVTASRRNRFHPLKDYFEGLGWDGKGRFDGLTTYFSDTHNVFPLYLKRWMIGAINKVYTGAQNPMLVLVGKQGMGKGFFAKWICPLDDLYLEKPIQPDVNDDKIRLTEHFVWEVAELGATTRRQDVEALKSFLTLESVTFRRPYGHFDLSKPALASFVGTVNDDGVGFLVDRTGNRRYRPVYLTKINRKYSAQIAIKDLWAEAYAAYKSGETVDLPADEEKRLNHEILPEYQVVNYMEELIDTYFERTDDKVLLSAREILKGLERIGYRGKGSNADYMDLARALKSMGFEKGSSGKKRGYKGIEMGQELTALVFDEWAD